ncbi:SPFH domain/Band 7 family protein [Emericellopsis atlantica]|uniref:SPFH domain/Band 7 family protein n=1 Tax=Emericellopsis atlantica TaxID=2614577 RepID=A0A9P7ZHW2_9HYPO|nr:SPFH domain/Band 7 family protein [Emericellopsis atlantica]KAG9252409.1 SPFH domain/Band 7 family protein [Emericellopsis atlantica]
MSYHISAPDEYLAITGMGIRTVRITKAAWVWPLQRCMRFSVQPQDYPMDLQAMTHEKLNFKLPTVFTIGPDVNQRGGSGAEAKGAVVDKGDALMKYAMLLADSKASKSSRARGGEPGQSEQQEHVSSIIKGIIEGETRVLVSSMTMEEIFTEREEFKRKIYKNIQEELKQFGLKIYNANVKELRDAPGSVYFESLSRKAHEGATNQARIDVAEAQLRGTVGEAQRKGEQERELAKISASTAVQRTERDAERAKAEALLQTQQASLDREVDIARAEATRALEVRDEELRKDVEQHRAAAETERLRASTVVKATIERESAQQRADADAYQIEAAARADAVKTEENAKAEAAAGQRQADAEAYTIQKRAEARAMAETRAADADAYVKTKDAEAQKVVSDAEAYATIKKAEGLTAMAGAYRELAGAFGGPDGLIKYLMIDRGTYVELANANSTAVQGMQPKISVWNTGDGGHSGAGGGGDPADATRRVYQMLPPLMETIHDQTGITLPEWQFGKMAAQTEAIGKEHKTNGER